MPAWTYAQLKTAYAAIGSPALATAVTTLNAQTTTLSNVPLVWSSVKSILRQASTGDWAKIVGRSRMVAASPPVSAVDYAVLAAINAVASENGDIFDPANKATWAAFQNGIAALQNVGDVSSATVSAVMALTSRTVPVWEPELTSNNVWVAMGQPA